MSNRCNTRRSHGADLTKGGSDASSTGQIYWAVVLGDATIEVDLRVFDNVSTVKVLNGVVTEL